MLQSIYTWKYIHVQNYFYGKNICLAKDETNSYMHVVAILQEQDVQLLDTLESNLELHKPWRRSYLRSASC